MMKNPVTLGLIQASAIRDKARNLDKTCEEIVILANQGAQIICLQELFASLYFCQEQNPEHFLLAESVPGPTTDRLAKIAKEKNVVIIASLFEKVAEGVFHNTAAVIDADGTFLGKYHKMHIPDDPSFMEKYYFAPGDLGYKVFQTKYARIGTLICWDQWYPEAARLTAAKGAQIIFYPTAIGKLTSESSEYGERQHHAWQTMQVSHAIANGVYVASVNRVGREDKIEFFGGSFVAGPFGDILAQASSHRDEHLLVKIDLGEIDAVRQDWPFWRDRRIDSYSGLTKRFDDK